jgi:hypothetical protein
MAMLALKASDTRNLEKNVFVTGRSGEDDGAGEQE